MSEPEKNDVILSEKAGEAEAKTDSSGAGEPLIDAKPAPDSTPAPAVATEAPVAPDAPSGAAPGNGPANERSFRPLAQAAAFAVAAGLGWVAGAGGFVRAKPPANPAQEAALRIDWPELAATIQKSHADTARLAGDMQLLRTSLGTLRETVDRSKQDVATRMGGLAERLDKAQRTEQDLAVKVAGIAERLDRPDREVAAKLVPAIEAKLAPVSERLDRIERQGLAIANTVAGGSTAAPAPKQTTAASEPTQTAGIPGKAKPSSLGGWVLRDVYKGMALLEGHNQRLIEITAGQHLPGVGRIEAIERRGKTWVVVTAKGIITSQQW